MNSLKRIVLFVIILSGLIGPVFATYTELTSYVNLPPTSGSYYSLQKIGPATTGTWTNISRVYVTGVLKNYSGVNYNEYPVMLKTTSCSGTLQGIGILNTHATGASDSYLELKNISISLTTQTDIFLCNGTSDLYPVGFNPNNTAPSLMNSVYLLSSTGNKFSGTVKTYSGTQSADQVNFTGYPLDGYNPLEVNFTISNYTAINSTAENEWYFGDGQISPVNGSTISHTYENAGIYSVSLHYWNTDGIEDTITKTNYVLASIPSGMIVNLDVKNAITGALIQDSTVGIRNASSGVWRNTTAPTGLVYFSTTDPGYLYPLSLNQTITLAANKSGYYDASDTFAIPYNNYRARLFLMPTSVTNATGAGTVVVNVVRNKDGLTVSGMSVVMDTGQIGITNSAGAVTLYNVTAGDRVVKVADPDGAYQDTEKSFSLTAGETELIVVQVVLEGESPVDVPVTPTTTSTFDPSDPSSYGEYGNYTAPQMNEAGGFVILQMLGQLFSLWPLVVMGIFFKFMKSAFS